MVGADGRAASSWSSGSSTTPAAIGPRIKLLGQAMAVLVLYLGGIRIERIDVLGLAIDLGHPSVTLDVLGSRRSVWRCPSLLVTMFWFLGCMNIWNLIDGMDGLASGVGLLVSGTLTLVAIHNQNVGVAITGRRRWPGASPGSCCTTGTRPASSWATAAAC